MPDFTGYAHIAITVSDHAVSVPFYEKIFETSPVGELVTDDFNRQIFPVGGGQVFGVTAYSAGRGSRFDFLEPGLDHVSFAVTDRDSVVALQVRLEGAGIPGDLTDAPYGTVLNIKDPDGIAIEFFAAVRRS